MLSDQKAGRKESKMIYTIEKRHEFGYGTMDTHYEVRSYTGKSEHTGALLNGKTLKVAKTLKQAEAYCRRTNINAERI